MSIQKFLKLIQILKCNKIPNTTIHHLVYSVTAVLMLLIYWTAINIDLYIKFRTTTSIWYE